MPNPKPASRRLRNGDISLRYADWGGANTLRLPPMVLLHGMRDAARSWDAFARAMASEYRVIALDSRGHGDSDWAGPNGYAYDLYVSDVAALFDALGLDDAIVVGHSAGGRYAWSYAVENPERVQALVIVDIDPDPVNPQTDRDFADIAAEPDSWDSLDDFADRLRQRQPMTADAELSERRRAPYPANPTTASAFGKPTFAS